MTNQEYADSLRKMADFYESHPGVPQPSDQVNVLVRDLLATARQLGTVEKRVDDQFFNLVKKFGGITVEFFNYRSRVCEKVLVGKKLVPQTVIPAKPEQIIPAKPEQVIPEHEVEEFEWHCPEALLENNEVRP